MQKANYKSDSITSSTNGKTNPRIQMLNMETDTLLSVKAYGFSVLRLSMLENAAAQEFHILSSVILQFLNHCVQIGNQNV